MANSFSILLFSILLNLCKNISSIPKNRYVDSVDDGGGAGGSSNTFLKGNKISCNEEGKIVMIPFLKSDPCITCMCINSEIDCFKNTCPQTLNCYHYASSTNNTDNCCRRCLSCRIGDRIINNGDSILDPNNNCKSYHCNSGTLTSSNIECHVPCDKPIRIFGQCCPSCNACPNNNLNDGDEVVNHRNNLSENDPCIKCYCFKGQMICHRIVCPVLPCHKSEWIYPGPSSGKKSCCPICKGNKVLDEELFQGGTCLIGGKIYQQNEQFIYDECTKCTCKNSTNVCHRESCPKLSCPETEQIKTEGVCCPKCQIPRVRKEMIDMQMDCFYQNRLLKDGEWTDSCKQCKCVQGKIECSNRICPHDFVCPFGHKKVRINGECCESCVPEDGRCIVKDLMSNITTYDGFNYHLNGRCNYILSKDCYSKKQFSIHLIHKFRNSSSSLPKPIYRGASMLIRIENTRILLSHLGRVRVNRTLVKLPYIQMGRFSIVQTQERVKLHAIIGVDILWQRNRSIEVKLKSHFRDQVCGLCGNFNLEQNDEFRSKNYGQLVSYDRFLNSFKVGKNLLCPKMIKKISNSNDKTMGNPEDSNFDPLKYCRKFVEDGTITNSNKQQQQQEQLIHSAIHMCNRLRKRHGPCLKHRKIDGDGGDDDDGEDLEEKIYGECLANMCRCRSSGDKQCQCYAIKNFLNNCDDNGNNQNGGTNFTEIWYNMCKSFECPPGSEFKFCSLNECGSYRKTCQNIQRFKRKNPGQTNIGCYQRNNRKQKCKSGCECTENYAWHNGKCIPEIFCPI